MKNAKKLLGLLLFVLLAWPAASRAATTRSSSSTGHTFLTLDDVPVCGLSSVSQTGNEITVKLGPGDLRSKPLAGWLWGSFSGSAPRMEKGSIVFTDHNYKDQRRLEFRDATLSGIEFPFFGAWNKGSVDVTLKLHVQATRSQKMSGEVWPHNNEPSVLGSGFRLFIAGVDTSHVIKVQLSPLVPRHRSTYRLDVGMYHSTYTLFKNWYRSRQKKMGELVIENSSGTVVLAIQLRGLLVTKTTWSNASRTGTAALTFDSIATR